jgi:hypothetical protein
MQQIGCSYHPQKGMTSNAAFHPTIKTVGFQTAFSVTPLFDHNAKWNHNMFFRRIPSIHPLF